VKKKKKKRKYGRSRSWGGRWGDVGTSRPSSKVQGEELKLNRTGNRSGNLTKKVGQPEKGHTCCTSYSNRKSEAKPGGDRNPKRRIFWEKQKELNLRWGGTSLRDKCVPQWVLPKYHCHERKENFRRKRGWKKTICTTMAKVWRWTHGSAKSKEKCQKNSQSSKGEIREKKTVEKKRPRGKS